jgi:hypothetical protein
VTARSVVAMSSLPTGLLAALTLVGGYAVAAATGVRALGGVVLLAGLAVCAALWRRQGGTRRAAVLVVVFVALFAASHLLALAVGAWPSVLLVAAAMFAASHSLADRAPATVAR